MSMLMVVTEMFHLACEDGSQSGCLRSALGYMLVIPQNGSGK